MTLALALLSIYSVLAARVIYGVHTGAIDAGRRDLARELAERNARCGAVLDERICLRSKEHQGDHEYESITRVIPFE